MLLYSRILVFLTKSIATCTDIVYHNTHIIPQYIDYMTVYIIMVYTSFICIVIQDHCMFFHCIILYTCR